MLENCGYKIENVWCNRDGFAFGTKFTQCDPCQVDRPKESQKRHANGSNDERDYIAENIRAVRGVAKGICKPVKIVKTVKYRLVPLQGVTFGKPSSEHIPMELLLQYHYAREWFRDRDRQLCDRIKKMKQVRFVTF